MNCPDCGYGLGYTTKKEKGFFHILEICAHCGYAKAYVDYTDGDTGPIDYSGIEY